MSSDNSYLNPSAPWLTTNGYPLAMEDHASLRAAALLNIVDSMVKAALAALPANTKKARRRAMEAIKAKLPQIDAELVAKAVAAGAFPSLEQFTAEYIRAAAQREGVQLDDEDADKSDDGVF